MKQTTPLPQRPKRRRFLMPVVVFSLFTLLILAVAPFLGSHDMNAGRVWRGMGLLLGSEAGLSNEDLLLRQIMELRVIRISLGLLTGAALGLAGASLQAVLRNPLVAPSTLGVTAAAAVGAFCVIVFPGLYFQITLFNGLLRFTTLQVASFGTALLDIVLIFFLARLTGRLNLVTLLLAGITLSLICAGLLMFLRHIAPFEKQEALARLMIGSLNTPYHRRDLLSIVPVFLICTAALLREAHRMNPVALGDEYAEGRGIPVQRMQTSVFVFSSLLTSSVVATVGPIGFVGLIVPHFVRRLAGVDQRVILFSATMAGGGFMVACDCLARVLFINGVQTPVGVITALLGGPVFLMVLLKTQRREAPL
ncbi:MAG: iron ABC transporter permease [Acidobacteriota bacterium]|nr:iron ABC transporter permease [Acidobacteriota bacterium]